MCLMVSACSAPWCIAGYEETEHRDTAKPEYPPPSSPSQRAADWNLPFHWAGVDLYSGGFFWKKSKGVSG